MKQPIFIMMCGIAGSGKSYNADLLSKEYNARIFSSDAYRKKLYGDESIQDNPSYVFNTLYNDLREALIEGNNVIFDATNITKKSRRSCLQKIADIYCEKIAYAIYVPLEKALIQNNSRDRHVPEDVIRGMFDRYTLPDAEEGFDKVIIM